MLCIFYQIKKKKKEPGGEKKAPREAGMVERSLGSSLSVCTPLPWVSSGLPWADDFHSRHRCSWLVPGHSRFKSIPVSGIQLRKHFLLLLFLSLLGCYLKWFVWVSGKVFLDNGHPRQWKLLFRYLYNSISHHFISILASAFGGIGGADGSPRVVEAGTWEIWEPSSPVAYVVSLDALSPVLIMTLEHRLSPILDIFPWLPLACPHLPSHPPTCNLYPPPPPSSPDLAWFRHLYSALLFSLPFRVCILHESGCIVTLSHSTWSSLRTETNLCFTPYPHPHRCLIQKIHLHSCWDNKWNLNLFIILLLFLRPRVLK